MWRRLGLEKQNCMVIVVSSIFLAFGLYHVHAQADVTEGGVLGMTLLLEHWFGISPAVSGFVMNAVCYAIGWRLLGKTFLAYSALSAVSFSAAYGVFEQFEPLWPGLYRYPLAAGVLGAVFVGIGVGLCVRMGGANSGDDALAMSIAHMTGMPIDRVYLVSDLTVLGLSLSYIPWERIGCSLLTVILSGQIIGWMQKPVQNPEK
ncbi:MAG: YitT family protein [Clostridia bacterium]|nr:YitT family protein [Clostridia bacterium]